MKLRPLWMAKFLPTNSGTIVQARAQVLIGSRLPVLSARYTFSSSRSTTYGPFFSERPMCQVPDPHGVDWHTKNRLRINLDCTGSFIETVRPAVVFGGRRPALGKRQRGERAVRVSTDRNERFAGGE